MEEQEREPKFHPGDRVRVREWDDMVKEYGENCLGTIMAPFGFVTDMKIFCGEEYTVEAANFRPDHATFQYTFVEDPSPDGYSFSEEMLEPTSPIDEDLFECSELGDYLNMWRTLIERYPNG